METHPATRILQQLHSTQHIQRSSTTSASASSTQKQFITNPETISPTKVNNTVPFATLIDVPREFIPSFPWITFLPSTIPQSTDVLEMTTPEPKTIEENIGFIFEQITTSSEPQEVTELLSNSHSSIPGTEQYATLLSNLMPYESFEKIQPAPVEPSTIIPQEVSVSWNTTRSIPSKASQQHITATPKLKEVGNNLGSLNRFLVTATLSPRTASEHPMFQPLVSTTATLSSPATPDLPRSITDTPVIPLDLVKPLPPTLMGYPKLPGAMSSSTTKPTIAHISKPFSVPVYAIGLNLFQHRNVSSASKPIVSSSAYHNGSEANPTWVKWVEQASAQNPVWIGPDMRSYQQLVHQALSPKGASMEPENISPTGTTETNCINKEGKKSVICKETYESVGTKLDRSNHSTFQVHPPSQHSRLPSRLSTTVNLTSQNLLHEKTKTIPNGISPCLFPWNGSVGNVCTFDGVHCPAGTFCQVGDRMNICCPVLVGPKCKQAMQAGVGPSFLLRWYFNSAMRQCQPFFFHGLQGNENNFESLSECQSVCGVRERLCEGGEPMPSTKANESCTSAIPSSCPSGYVCKLVDRRGFCCPDLGIGHNKEDFHSLMPDETSTICNLPVRSGHGTKFISRFFFSREYGQCLHFIYSGAGGNLNNFANVHDCQQICMGNTNRYPSLPVTGEPSPSIPFERGPLCPHGDVERNGTIPMRCDVTTGTGCSVGFVCTPIKGWAFCCQAPESFCLQPRPALSVCLTPFSPPVQRIEFTYDAMGDRCVQFSYASCSPSLNLNHFSSRSHCRRLCCNQGHNLVYKRMLLLMNNSPVDKSDDQRSLH